VTKLTYNPNPDYIMRDYKLEIDIVVEVGQEGSEFGIFNQTKRKVAKNNKLSRGASYVGLII
jgi:hypothetical protein